MLPLTLYIVSRFTAFSALFRLFERFSPKNITRFRSWAKKMRSFISSQRDEGVSLLVKTRKKDSASLLPHTVIAFAVFARILDIEGAIQTGDEVLDRL